MSPLSPNGIPPVHAIMNLRSQSSSVDSNDRLAFEARALKIVTDAQAGSAAAFDELQKLYSARLFQTVFRITKNREDAEDALQDTFLRAYVALRKFEARSSVYSWLTRIAMNSALMILRRRRSRPEAILSCLLESEEFYAQLELKDPAPDPEQICALRELSNELSLAIQRLKPRLRAPIEIRLDRELSLKELAHTLNLSVSAVKARLCRARAYLTRKAKVNGVGSHVPLGLIGKSPLISHQNRERHCPASG